MGADMQNRFNNIKIDYSWSFGDKKQGETNYLTHGFYTYPAKFIPHLAQRLIKQYSKENEVVLDPFMGSGTTILESILHNRIAFGCDINEIAFLISKVKVTPLNINELQKEFINLESNLIGFDSNSLFFQQNIEIESIIKHERINYWFKEEQIIELNKILYFILKIDNENIRDFFKIAFAQILKSTSIWLQKSIKPTRDLNKKINNPTNLFLTQAKKMIKKHKEYLLYLDSKAIKNIDKCLYLTCCDCRKLSLKDNSVDLIVTSPPYVTSYEYADLHQLPNLWFSYMDDLCEFQKKFIGSNSKMRENIDLKSNIALNIIESLGKNKKAKEVYSYYADMLECFVEMKRVLKPKGKFCIIIGNTQFKGVDILNAEVFVEQLCNIGFKIVDIINREIPSKMLPSTRDSKIGRFSKAINSDKLVYPTEYILIMEK
ncbi:MAG: DNA methyltransferase [Helicobacter sp.]|nr:DNA methyltransferase [Helicobacter sp.]